MPIFNEKLDLVPFLIFRISKKAPFGHHFQPKRVQRQGRACGSERPCHDPAFHKTRVITVPLGPTGFKMVVLRI